MIEVHPKLSEASHLRRSSIHLTQKLISAKIKLHPDEESHVPSLQNTLIFSEQDCHSNHFGLRNPVIQN